MSRVPRSSLLSGSARRLLRFELPFWPETILDRRDVAYELLGAEEHLNRIAEFAVRGCHDQPRPASMLDNRDSPLDRTTEDLLQDDEDRLTTKPVVLLLELEDGNEEVADGLGEVGEALSSLHSQIDGDGVRPAVRRAVCEKLTDEILILHARSSDSRKLGGLLREALDDGVHHRRGAGAEHVVDARGNRAVEGANEALAGED